ncbi:hypothetical protein B9J78_03180 [bacterium Unc6]|nr:hypothetical protein [bacterium Unc6]
MTKGCPLIIFLSVLLLFLPGCATIYNPATERQEFVFIDTQQEVALGQKLSYQIQGKYVLIHNNDEKRVQEIGKRIASVSDRKDINYNFFVVKDKNINAFALPGGYVYVHTGLLNFIKTDDELACVIGHEIGHIAARHPIKRLEAVYGYSLISAIVFRDSSDFSSIQEITNTVFSLIVLGYGREDELLADRLGIKYSRKAGYNPSAMVDFLKRLKVIENKKVLVPVWARTHPDIDERIKIAEQEILIYNGR